MSNLERFIKAQDHGIYEYALREIQQGQKRTHWMWFIFPQVKGLGISETSIHYGIDYLREAREYMEHPVLSKRLVEISKALLPHDGHIEDILGWTDALKLRSSMTLFEMVSDEPVFGEVLDKFYDGRRDVCTVELIEQYEAGNIVDGTLPIRKN